MNELNTPLEQIIETRRAKLAILRESGVNPYPAQFKTSCAISEIHEKYGSLKTGESCEDSLTSAGRIVSRREMGKASFIDIADASGKLQVYVRSDFVGAEMYKVFNDSVDIADFIGVKGSPFRTRTGELSLKAESWVMLAKTLRPLPEKWHGLKDTEIRYRQRYLDLISNPDVKNVFIKRSGIISSIRQELIKKGFLEVETPIMQAIAGGAAAKPFTTHHNALDIDLFMRIAPELYLKRLVVGGMEKVFEIGRNFRNEGIDRNHNPEFTMLELYQAYSDYNTMMELAEELIVNAAKILGKDMPVPFKRIKFFDSLKDASGIDFKPLLGTGKIRQTAKDLKLDAGEKTTEKKILDQIFDNFVTAKLKEPTFVLDYPAEYSPLAKSKAGQPDIAERFELYMNGMEIANAYSELNDPEEQKKRFEKQMEDRKKGDEEAQAYDADFITAIEHGLPPTGGLGIGIDRLVMVLAEIESVREVILFPTLRPEL
ncbi:MAG: lysine--tRNA ligase [Elusimicrobiota bacterium]